MKKSKKSQIWVETVIYTLIALVVIGLALSYSKPKIEETQDKMIIEQSVNIMNEINIIILKIFQMGEGNRRKIEMNIRKGNFIIDGINDSIEFEIYGNYEYTELGSEVVIGDKLVALTREEGRYKKVKLTLNLTDFNVTYNGKDEIKSIGKSAVPYQIFITNHGGNETVKTKIDFIID